MTVMNQKFVSTLKVASNVLHPYALKVTHRIKKQANAKVRIKYKIEHCGLILFYLKSSPCLTNPQKDGCP